MRVTIETTVDPIRAQQLQAVLAELLTPKAPLPCTPDKNVDSEELEVVA
jgi:hypothetical protein